MINLPEQFSAVQQSQVDAQLALFNEFGARALHNAEQIVALNMDTTRAALERTEAAMRQLMAAQDPRDLIALTTEGQHYFDSLAVYGQALIGIVAGSTPAPTTAAPAPFPEAQLEIAPAKAAKKK